MSDRAMRIVAIAIGVLAIVTTLASLIGHTYLTFFI